MSAIEVLKAWKTPTAEHPVLPKRQVAFVDTDEYCLRLSELNLIGPGLEAVHRFQCFIVVRGDKLTEYRRDLGPMGFYVAEEFNILGGARDDVTGHIHIVSKVGKMLDIADTMREEKPFWWNMEQPDLWKAFHEQQDDKKTGRLLKGVFGPMYRRQT